MYQKKSEIIGRIQSYHKQVRELYIQIKTKIDNSDSKKLIDRLCEIETDRIDYLEKRRKVAEAMNCWLDFPDEKLSTQITECFKKINLESDITVEKLIDIELHFSDCLIKLYGILSSQNELNVPKGCETVSNIFHYMQKDAKKKRCLFCDMLKHD
ncbi:MAG TPA: hypothetical protein PLV06_00005 [Bacteroidales bacterium]|nr:hypothetical protein [Bacteroidales bacterium]HPI69677.1 hypothetical protein [Bacteroidales bacterium]HPR10737.1 hypothetical protein [Bacteroidales bacterium]